MNTFVLLFVAAAIAHWPYPDQEDKFRTSGVSINGNSATLDSNFHWVFSPFNNQLAPTFQLRFPNVPLVMTNSKNGLLYTISLDHLAEVAPGSGTFSVKPGTLISFDTLLWYTDVVSRFYDVESMGEVIETVLYSYENFGEWNGVGTHDLLNQFPVAIRIRIFPDSQDDLVDITIHIEDYVFMGWDTTETPQIATSHLALFWKLSSSSGEAPFRSIPLGLDYEIMTFEVEPDVKFLHDNACPPKRSMRNATSVAPFSLNRATMKALRKQNMKRLCPEPTDVMFQYPLAPNAVDHTTAQMWISSGYVATVFGVIPSDITGTVNCIDIETTVSLSARSFRAPQEVL